MNKKKIFNEIRIFLLSNNQPEEHSRNCYTHG